MISAIIPVGANDSPDFVKSTFTGADEILEEREGTWSEAQNRGAGKAKGDILVFVDCDMDLQGLDVSKLDGDFDLASALYMSPWATTPWDMFHTNLQNFSAEIASPWMLIGGFMWMKKYVWEALGGFRETWWPDVEFAHRAYLSGFKLGYFNVPVVHRRPFSPRTPYLETKYFWGVP